MGSFEQAFRDVERAANSTARSAADLGKLAKALEKAAKDGNIAAIKRAQARLDGAVNALRQETANAAGAWPLQEAEEEAYLKEGYSAELRSIAAEKGLNIYERDGRLFSSPSLLQVLPGSRAVRIDRKQVSNIRPSRIVEVLIKNRNTPPRFQSGPFLESLYDAYKLVIETPSLPLSENRQGVVVPLEKIYQVFTSLPGSGREYGRMDFARDLYILDAQGPRQTRTGMNVDFPASTGTRGSGGVFSFIDPDGRVISYYGIRFSQRE